MPHHPHNPYLDSYIAVSGILHSYSLTQIFLVRMVDTLVLWFKSQDLQASLYPCWAMEYN